MTELYKILTEKIGEGYVLKDEPMSRHTTFKVGGPASLFVSPGSEEELFFIISECISRKIRYYVIGNGSNLLVMDSGYDGVIIEIGRRMSEVRTEGDRIYAMAGAPLSLIASAARENGLEGLEFASGIPGNLGGAVVMNAGAYGGEMKDVLESVRLMDKNGKISESGPDRLEMGYRHSNIPEKELTVLSAVFALKKGNRDEIEARTEDLKQRRISKQPLEYPSAGSTFKRPEGHFAGKLISDAGLKGYRTGGAMVSEKHAGFVINTGNATAEDILKLTEHVMETVKNKYGVVLEREIKLLG